MKRFLPKSSKGQEGFTLIELMVSLMLFVIVVLAAVGSLYSVNTASRKVQAMRQVLDNLNFAVESISRTVRTSSNIVCGGTQNSNYAIAGGVGHTHNCSYQSGATPGTYLLMSATLGSVAQVQYRWWINGATGVGEIDKQTKDATGTWSNWVSLTAPEINVQNVSFYVDGADADDDKQPSVILLVQGKATSGQDITPFAIQTMVSQRSIEQ